MQTLSCASGACMHVDLYQIGGGGGARGVDAIVGLMS